MAFRVRTTGDPYRIDDSSAGASTALTRLELIPLPPTLDASKEK